MIVYEITCLADGRRYIGSTIQALEKRWGAHCSLAYQREISPLHKAIREHGEAAFAMRAVASARTVPELRALERIIIRQEGTTWPAGFNAGTESAISANVRYKRAAQFRPRTVTLAVVEHTDRRVTMTCGHIRYRTSRERHWPPTVSECLWCTHPSKPPRRKRATVPPITVAAP